MSSEGRVQTSTAAAGQGPTLKGSRVLLWHPEVHHHFDEDLWYFFIELSQFHPSAFEDLARKLTAEFRLSGFCIYPALGAYDIILRIWLNPVDEEKIQSYLNGAMRDQDLVDVVAFKARRGQIEHWPFDPGRPVDVLPFSPEQVDNTQRSGDRRTDLEELGLAFHGQISDSDLVKFYVAIGSVPQKFKPIKEIIHDSIRQSARELEAAGSLQKVSFYSGDGFCSMLVKALAKDFRAMFALATSVRERISQFQMLSSTFVVSTDYCLECDDINESSLLGVPRFDKYTMQWVPELYELAKLRETGRTKIRHAEDYLGDQRFFNHLPTSDQDWVKGVVPVLVHRTHLRDGSLEGARAIGSRLAMVEHWLRTNAQKLLRGLARDDKEEMSAIARDCHVPGGDRYGTLSQWLTGYAAALSHDPEFASLFEFTSELEQLFSRVTSIRNDCDHSDGGKTVADWTAALTDLAEFLPVYAKMQELTEIAFARVSRLPS